MPKRRKNYYYPLSYHNQNIIQVNHIYSAIGSKLLEETGLPAIMDNIRYGRAVWRFLHICPSIAIRHLVSGSGTKYKLNSGILVRHDYTKEPRYWCNNCGKITSKQQTKVLDFINL